MNERENTAPFLSVEHLTVEYTAAGDVIHAVNDVSFTLQKGQTLGLVGETGAGKTTIAKSILRILPDPPAKVRGGKTLLDGVDLMALSDREMRRIRGKRISMIFQDPMTALNPVFTVGEQIGEVLQLHEAGISKADAYQKACDMLVMVGIPAERYGEYPHQFSGGMKQRVVIAIALACSPELLLADEPTTALDVTIQAQVLDMIKRLRDQHHTSLILITHDLGVVAEVCDAVAVVYAGQIIEMGSREEIFDHPMHPYTIGLFSSLPSLAVDKERLDPIAGLPPDPRELPRGCHFNPRCPYATDGCRGGDIPLYEVRPGHMCRCIMPRKEHGHA